MSFSHSFDRTTELMTEPHSLDVLQAREKILEAASRLFAQQGYEETSLSQVARQANVSKALIFWHFDSKEKLYQHALRKTLEPYVIDNDALIGLGGREQIERLIDLFFSFVRENVYSVRFFLNLTLRGEPQQDEGLSRVTELYRMFRSSLADIIESGRLQAAFRDDCDPAREAALIMATLAGVLVQQFMTADTPDGAKELVDYFKASLFQRLTLPADGGTAAGRLE